MWENTDHKNSKYGHVSRSVFAIVCSGEYYSIFVVFLLLNPNIYFFWFQSDNENMFQVNINEKF